MCLRKSYFKEKLGLLAFFVLSSSAAVGAQSQCRTPNGYAGNCMLLEKCEPLANINSYQVKTPEDILFLRQSNCGLYMNWRPKVCCPAQNQWADFSTMRPETYPTIIEEKSSTRAPTTIRDPLIELHIKPFRPATFPTIIEDKSSTRAPTITRDPLIELHIKPLLEQSPATERTTTTKSPFIDRYNPLPDKYIPENTCEPTIKPPEPECCGIEAEGENRIIGGQIAGSDQYPWLALLVYNGTGSKTACGGALISARYVLTAAHCLGRTNVGWPVKVRLAEYNTSTYPTDIIDIGDGFEQITVVEIGIASQLQHSGYIHGAVPLVDDIGLIKLRRNAPYTDFIRPICLPTRDISDTSDPDFDLVAAGWGSDGEVASTEVKQFIKLPFVPLKECKTAFGRTKPNVDLIVDTHICAGGKKSEDTCSGDSGGPLMYYEDDTYTHTIVGIVSFGDKTCGKEGKPAAYTNVYKYLDWIVENMI